MSALADKIRRARESKVETAGRVFVIRRPTDAETITLSGMGAFDVVCRFCTGWNLTELDLVPGGSGTPVEFDADAFREWVADQPDVLADLSRAILEAYKAHAEKRGAAEKN